MFFPTFISLTPNCLTLGEGEKYQFRVYIQDQNKQLVERPDVQWDVPKGSLGTITQDGLYCAPAKCPRITTVEHVIAHLKGTYLITHALVSLPPSGKS